MGLEPSPNPNSYTPNPTLWQDPLGLACGRDHVVLGLNPASDRLAEQLRAAGDLQAHTFNGGEYGVPGISGRPKWMEGVEDALNTPTTKISVVLDGLRGESLNEAFANAYRQGVPLQGCWQAAARGQGTAWELAKLGNKVRFGQIAWGDIDFYHNNRKLENFAEPNWVALRKDL